MLREISIALDRYDRHFPIFDGTATTERGLKYRALQVGQSLDLRDGRNRHGRMIHEREFDVAEFSMSTFIMAIDRGLPLVGIPVFPRRLFSQSSMYVLAGSQVSHPSQLEGRRIGLLSFQTSLSVIARGDLCFEYGADWESITWVCSEEENVAPQYKKTLRVERLTNGYDLGEALAEGLLDAIFVPNLPMSARDGKVRLRPIFRDPKAEEERYYQECGLWPIMHVLVTHKETLEELPGLSTQMQQLFGSAFNIATKYYNDPNWSMMPWGRSEFLRSEGIIRESWQTGLSANEAAISQFLKYSLSQGLLNRSWAPRELFRE